MGLSRTPLYPFFEYSSSQWVQDLTALKNRGIDDIRIPLLWSIHEQRHGDIDFVRAPRLRFDKLLSAVRQVGLRADVILGFPIGFNSIPAWALRQFACSAKIPAAAMSLQTGSLDYVSFPSLQDPALVDAFCTFVEAVAPLIALHADSSGAIRNVIYDPGIFGLDAAIHHTEMFASLFSHRYGDEIQSLNLAYQSHFPAFSTALQKQGIRTLLAKRPWLFAHDYKWCRSVLTRTIEPRLETIVPLTDVSNEFVRTQDLSSWGVYADAVPLENFGDQNQFLPFAPESCFNSESASAFRMCEYFSDSAIRAGVGWHWLDDSNSIAENTYKKFIVIAGRYLPRTHVEAIRAAVLKGSEAYFVLAIPQYDERLQRVSWGTPASRDPNPVVPGFERHFGQGEGAIFAPTRAWSPCEVDQFLQRIGSESSVGRLKSSELSEASYDSRFRIH